MRKFIRQIPHSYKCVLVFCIGELIAALIYAPLSEYAQNHRLSSAPGGEMLVWLLGFILAFAYDTYKKGKISDEEQNCKQ